MLDQRLLRENPDLIEQQLARRGAAPDLGPLCRMAVEQRDLEERRNSLQAEGNGIGREVGQLLRSGTAADDPAVVDLREQGNRLKQQVADLDERVKELGRGLLEDLRRLPNLPSAATPDGRSEADNVERHRWGDPRREEGLLEHWQIAERLGLFENERSVRIAQSRFEIGRAHV